LLRDSFSTSAAPCTSSRIYATLSLAATSFLILIVAPLPIRTTTENIDGVEYEYTWKGDEIIGVYPNTDFFPFYATAG
jgi:hypothetical protein